MGRKPDDVKVTTSGGLSVMGEITLSSGGKTVKLGGNPTEHLLPAKRMERALTKLQDAMSAIKLAAEELHIVDAEMIGSDANRRVTVEASKEDPIKVSDDIESHRMQAAEMKWYDDYLAEGGVDRDANPTPGNKKGGNPKGRGLF